MKDNKEVLKQINNKLEALRKKNASTISYSKKLLFFKENVAFDLIAYVLVGLFIGYKLDNFFKTKPLFIIIFVLLAFITFFVKIYKKLSKIK